LPFVLVGSRDASGQPWASILTGAPGFLSAADPRRLRIDTLPAAGGPLADHLAPGAKVGLLGIWPATRRRNRLNGTVAEIDGTGFSVAVDQSFGNCPKYIQARDWSWRSGGPAPITVAPERDDTLSAADLAQIAAADTFFIATAHSDSGPARSHGADVSHRGGAPGFVHHAGGGQLVIPDYSGNFLFQTFGNLAVNPCAGLLFPDFGTGDLLQLAGAARVEWDPAWGAPLPEPARKGAQRFLIFETEAVRRTPGGLPLAWSAPELSPHLAQL
jgi:predicted pyridoxine 5'-phosphate oxidase superfamily flavin-nucleotide-binding protein